MDEEGEEPDAYGEEEILRVVVGVLRPDDHRVEADERLDDGQYHQQCCQDFQIFLLRIKMENPEKKIIVIPCGGKTDKKGITIRVVTSVAITKWGF